MTLTFKDQALWLLLLLFTFRFFNGMADTKSVAHVVKGLVARIAPLIDVVTGAGPDQVVQCIIACPYSPKGFGTPTSVQHSVWHL